MYFGLKRSIKIMVIAGMVLLLGACTTQKRKGDLSLMGKLWHNTTAHYNGYFNADELMTASFQTLEDQYQDNYNKMLPMYEYIATDNHQAVVSDLDEAIKKVSVVVNLHRQSNWTDDCYLLVGKAQFLKKDYESAEETLRFMMDEFSPAKMAKLEKEANAKKSKKGRSSKSRTSKSNKDDKGEVLSGREAEKERKRYNRELKKKRRQANKEAKKRRKNRKKGRKNDLPKIDIPEKAEKPAEEAESPEAVATEVPEEPVEAAPGMISLNKSSELLVDPDPPNYFMKHRPAYQEGVLWLAKTLIERDNYDNALRLLSQLERDPNTFDDVRDQLAGVQAYYFIKRKDYPQAITYLEQAVASNIDRNDRARFAYVKAQLQQRMGQSQAAYASFEEVLKLSNIYELEFSARLNMAQNQWRSGSGTGEEAKRNLEKMLKDPKNAEYEDQIYYALGEIALESGERAEAIAYFQQSLNSNSSNNNQKAEAYYRLGRLFYEEEDFVDAKAYFDSTLQVMPATDDRYQEVKKQATNLTEIAANLELITLQDSLLRISQMTDEQRLELATTIKQKQDEAKLQAALAASENKARNAGNNRIVRTVSTRGALKKESSFFAYNDRALRNGKRAFERKWGDRPMEDDWRRSNKSSGFGPEEETVAEETVVAAIDPNNVSEYLGDYPKTPADVEKSNSLIREAMFELGSLYRERLNNFGQTVNILEVLNERYPGSNYELDSWYMLYLTYKDLNNSAKADEYLKKILEKYPSTNYAKLLKDPNYASEYLDEERQLNRAYDQVYAKFSSGNFQDAYSDSQKALQRLVGQHPLKPKYALLMAMSVGNLKGKDAYIQELQRVVATYPDSDEQKRAKEILRALGVSGARLPGGAEEASSKFTYNENELHYIIVVFKEGQGQLNDLRNKISDYNEKYHKLDKIRPASIYLGQENKTPVVVLRRYKDKNAAMRYYEGVQKNSTEFVESGITFDILPISQNNYRQIIRQRSVDGYKEFFDSNY